MAKKSTSKLPQWLSAKRLGFRGIFLIVFWGLILIGLGAGLLLYTQIKSGKMGYMPPLAELQNPEYKFATEVFSEDLVSLGRYFEEKSNRVAVEYEDLPDDLIHALIATEDARFYEHSGVDFRALMRVALKFGKNGGGSTVTQQLAKLLWTKNKNVSKIQRMTRKPAEWVIAVQLERLYSKEEILLMYFNQFDFLNNAVGIQSAAQVYFGKQPIALKTEECATLVGMCQNPSLYNPRRFPERCQLRRNTVLSQMVKYGYLSQHDCDSLSALPVTLNYHAVDHKEGLAPYFRETIRQQLTGRNGILSTITKPDGTPYSLYSDGLRIYTTIDSRMQQYAEAAVHEHMTELQDKFFREQRRAKNAPFDSETPQKEIDAALTKGMRESERYKAMRKAGADDEEIRKVFNTPIDMSVFSYRGPIDTTMSPMDSVRWSMRYLRCGFMAIDPHTGHVKAYVGGPDFGLSQFDMVHRGRRQVGSTIKPYLYTLAMANGMNPCDTVVNDSVTFVLPDGNLYTPRAGHADHPGEVVTLSDGLAQSSNWITARLMKETGPVPMRDLMRSFGISGNIDPVPSLCLGPCEVSVEEMADAYTTFVNHGIRTQPVFITRIEDRDGNIIYTHQAKTEEVIDEETSYKMITMLRNVVESGTGRRLKYTYRLQMPIGGKTGTSQNNADGWFVGFTPEIVGAAWVGGENSYIHFANMSYGQGAASALPIFGLFLQKVYSDQLLGYDVNRPFDIPEWYDASPCK